MDIVVLIGRLLFVIVFLTSAIGHLAQTGSLTPYARGKGVPRPELAVRVSGLLMLLGSLSILFGIWADLGALLLVLVLAPLTFLMHGFWRESDPAAMRSETVSFNKNLALIGAALLLFVFFAHTGELGPTVTGPFFAL